MFRDTSIVIQRLFALKARLSKTLANVDSKYWEIAFLLGVLSYAGIAYVDSLEYHDEAQLFPQMLIAALVGLIALRFVFDFAVDLFDVRFQRVFDVAPSERIQDTVEGHTEESTPFLRIVGIFLFISGLTVLTWLVGFFPSMTVFIFAFTYYYSRDVMLALVSVVVGVSFSYLLFRVLLSVPLWRGVLFQ